MRSLVTLYISIVDTPPDPPMASWGSAGAPPARSDVPLINISEPLLQWSVEGYEHSRYYDAIKRVEDLHLFNRHPQVAHMVCQFVRVPFNRGKFT